MMTTSEPSNLDPQMAALKNEVFYLVTGIANLVNKIGTSTPEWGPETTDTVNKNLDPSISNIARLPDELSRAIVQVAGANLHQIGQMMEHGFTSPATVAPLARSCIENVALLLFINRDEDSPEVRTVRAARAIRSGMTRDKVHTLGGLAELHQELNTVVQRYTAKHTILELKQEDVSYSDMVRMTLNGVIGEDLYGDLCSYTHHNAWRAYYQFLVAGVNPTQLELDSLFFAFEAARAVTAGGFALAKYRDSNATSDLLEGLRFSIDRLIGLGRMLNDFQQNIEA
ncbi:hypothetical protein [Corynebacterium vitaeruminis]|uniref:Uncharacterized protein n=1 Tax=Corynebacterium vitaeruminis DSM 20294 TaxID=1224164 RepID=W5Y506_9CORY|nr:hypothetical protein [Corynebacterium vitaeruminis]AHI23920.1 hypothetical protein B843_12720 [Corynebacterium vitaeruminis DSM 20294]